jgi:hypothetical protein
VACIDALCRSDDGSDRNGPREDFLPPRKRKPLLNYERFPVPVKPRLLIDPEKI